MKCHRSWLRLWHWSERAAGYQDHKFWTFRLSPECACIQTKYYYPQCKLQPSTMYCANSAQFSLREYIFYRGPKAKYKPSVCCLHKCVCVCVCVCACVCVPICVRQAHPQSDLHHFRIAPAVSQASHPLSHWLLKGALGTLCADTPVPETAGWSSPASQPVNCLSCTHHLSLLLIWLRFCLSVLSSFFPH